MELKIGSNDQNTDGEVTRWQHWVERYAASYSHLMGPIDGYYGNSDAALTSEMQRRLKIPVTGRFDDFTATKARYAWGGKDAPAIPPEAPVTSRRKIWLYSAPGSGADYWVGPSFELGEFCKKVLKINHQPMYFQKGGYLGLMGGDPAFSYNDVTFDEYKSLEWLLDNNPDINDPDLELWLSGYSQSADGMEDALEILFGDGCSINGKTYGTGKYAHIRSRINGSIQFGNPSRQEGRCRIGRNAYTQPPGWGISRKRRPAWLQAITYSITAQSPGAPDFYACTDDDIRPLFYEWFVKAETELPFVVYCAKIIVPALLNLIAPFLGSLGGNSVANPLAGGILAGATGLPISLLGPILGGITGSGEQPNPKLIELLSVKGVLTNIPQLIHLLTQLSGIQTHGEYHLPKSEFNGRTGIQVACDIVADFRR